MQLKILIKETDYASSSLNLPFYCNSQEKHFLKGILGRKVTVSEAYLEPCQTSVMELLRKHSQQLKVAIYF